MDGLANVQGFNCIIVFCRYEVNFQDGIDCGGAYIKLLSDSGDLNLVSKSYSYLKESLDFTSLY